MKEKIKQAKIGLAVVCIAAVLTAAFLIQPTPNRSIPVADTSINSSVGDSEGSTVSADGSQTESSTSNSSSPAADTPSSTPSTDKPTASESGTTDSSQAPSSSTPGMKIDPETGKDKILDRPSAGR